VCSRRLGVFFASAGRAFDRPRACSVQPLYVFACGHERSVDGQSTPAHAGCASVRNPTLYPRTRLKCAAPRVAVKGRFGLDYSNGEPAVPKFTDPGKWYFVVDCLDCESPIPLAGAPSPAEKPDPLRYRAISEVRCPHCGGVGTYTPRQISRRLVEHAPGDRLQAPILYALAGIAGLSFLAAVLFITHTYR
jgi:hypothetical protein